MSTTERNDEMLVSNGAPLRFYGASDDLVEMDGGAREEWSAIDGTATLEIVYDGVALLVEVTYGGTGTWAVTPLGSVADDGESVTLPWPVRLIDHATEGYDDGSVPTYSLALVVDAPEGATVTRTDADSDA